MCAKCFRLCLIRLRFGGRREIRRPTDLTNVLDRITPYVQRGVLTVVQDIGPFEKVLRNPWSDDVHLIALRCVKCEEEFQLHACRGLFWLR